jgi:hypothetical protein
MEAKELVTGMKLTRAEQKRKKDCVNCDITKMKRMSFHKTSPQRTTVPFMNVFMDLGFIQPPTVAGHTVYLHLIDEGSRYQWLYMLKTKDETVNRLRGF